MMNADKQLKDLEIQISKGLKEAFTRMLDFKKRMHTPVVISRDGNILKIDPEDISNGESKKNKK